MRRKDFDKLSENKTNDFEELIKNLKGSGDKENLNYKYRFLNTDYTKDLYGSYKQEVVFKIIKKGSGKKHLSILIDYLSRESESQDDKKKCSLFDHNNDLIENDQFQDVIDSWSLDFEPESKKSDPIIDEALIEYNKLETALEDKYFDSCLTREEGEVYRHIKNLKESKFDSSEVEKKPTDKVKFGQFCYFEEDHKFGILVKEPDCKFPLLVTTDEDYKIEKIAIFDTKFVKPINKEMRLSLSQKPKDFSHVVLSAGGDNPDRNKTEIATKQFLEENFKAKGYEYIYTTHDDTKNLHTHVIINNYSKYNEHKFSPNKFDLQELRIDYRNKLDELGIDRSATYVFDRKNCLDILKNKAENIKNFKTSYYEDRSENLNDYNFDIVQFRKNSLREINNLSDQLYRKGEHKLAMSLLEEKKKYDKIKVENIADIVSNTQQRIEKEAPQISNIVKKNFLKRIGTNKDYEVKPEDQEVKYEVLEKYMEHLEQTKENIEELLCHPKMTPELEKQQDKALEYIDKRMRALSRESGLPYDDEGRGR